jgi:lysyl-tRNA synthetase, class II
VKRGAAGNRAWRWAAAGSTALCGLLTVISALTEDVPWRRAWLVTVEPGPVIALSHVLALGAGAALVYLAWGILDRRRRALDVAVVVLVAVSLLHLVKGLDYEEAAVGLVLAGVLARGRRVCTRGTGSRPPLMAVTIAVGTVAAFYIAMCATFRASRVTRLVISGGWLHAAEPMRIVLVLLFGAALAAAASALHGLLRPLAAREGHSADEHERAVGMTRAFGDDSLAPFVLREDKAFFFAHGGFVAYRTLHETAVVSGDPIGPPGSAPAILEDFLAYADRCGWRVAVAAASPGLAAVTPNLGLRALQVGSEAVVDATAFTLEGRAIRKVRQALARVERHGWTTDVVAARDLDPPTREQVAALEHEFTSSRPRVYGFAMSLGRLWGAPEDDDALYALARDPSGVTAAFIRFLPYRRGLSLDAVRRRPDMPNGVCETLVVRALDRARATGLREVSLNFAGFAHVMAPAQPLRLRERMLRLGLSAVHGRFQLERLVVFGDHFGPAWRPRYLLYASRLELPKSALRVLQAEHYLPSRAVPPLRPRWEPSPPPLPGVPQLQRR